jgi:imidazolonepropionase-like amidohydrolase
MLVIKAGRAFDGERQLPGGAVVFVDEGRIAGVEPATAPLPAGWPVAEFPTATVLPGLIDTHVHLSGDGADGALNRLPHYRDDELAAVIAAALRRHLAVGVTTVRDLGDRHWCVLEWRDRVVRGCAEVIGPTILASGPPITSVGGHCWQMGGEAGGATQLRAAIRERVERRADIVKIMASGGATTAGTDLMGSQFTGDELRLMVDAAHAAGLPVTVHAHGLAAVEQAVDAGVDGIEHCTCLTPSGMDLRESLLASLAERRIAVCPTLGMVTDPVRSAGMRAALGQVGLTWDLVVQQMGNVHRAGVRLVSGSDGGVMAAKPHGLLPAAVADLVTAGVPACQALASATSVAAQECGLGTRKGRLCVGQDADLLLVDGDPLSDIHALTRTVAVMAGGQWCR